jgi:hypothetical protein
MNKAKPLTLGACILVGETEINKLVYSKASGVISPMYRKKNEKK